MLSPEQFGDLTKSFITNKAQVVDALLTDLESLDKQTDGLASVLDNWEKVEANPDNAVKQLKTAIKCVKNQSEMNRRILMILMVYIAGDNFSSDSAKMLIKLGRGKEAVRAMAKEKFGDLNL